MSSLVIRARSCTPASSAELTDWLEEKLAELREDRPELIVRMALLARDLPDATFDDGWLIEVELQGKEPAGPFASMMASVAELLRDMRILGLDPILLVPVRLPFGEGTVGLKESKLDSASFHTVSVKT